MATVTRTEPGPSPLTDCVKEPQEIIAAMSEANIAMAAKLAKAIIQLRLDRDQFTLYAKNHTTKAEGFRHKANGQFKDDPIKRENLLEEAQASDEKADTNKQLANTIGNLLAELMA